MRDYIAKRLEHYIPVPESGCWIWLGTSSRKGYGIVLRGRGKNQRAHRWFYEHYIGPIPDGLHVLHKCDTPACVNPAHLFVGTDLDNWADRERKGRGWLTKGEHHGRAKLSKSQVMEIRQSKETIVSLAARFGVGRATIWDIKSGRSWKFA